MKSVSIGNKVFAILALTVLATQAHAQLVGVSGSKTAPASVLGSYTMTSFADDTRADYHYVNSVSAPFGDLVSFNKSLAHFEVGSGWATWSNGYKGDVYYYSGVKSLTLTLPSLTKAFYFYAESNERSNHRFTVSSGDVTLKETVNGNGGAEQFAFYATGSAYLSSITISSNDIFGFAIGEFGIAKGTTITGTPDELAPVPEPSTYALFGAAGLCGLFFVRRARRKNG